jgi:hypothetical protein
MDECVCKAMIRALTFGDMLICVNVKLRARLVGASVRNPVWLSLELGSPSHFMTC